MGGNANSIQTERWISSYNIQVEWWREKQQQFFRQKDGDQNSKQVKSSNCACKRI